MVFMQKSVANIFSRTIFRKLSLTILFIWVFFLSLLYSLLSILRHNHFQSGGFDLGIYDQAIWQYAHFLIPYSTIKERLILGDHLTLTLPLISPLFYIWDNVRVLLIFQAFVISFSTIAIYKIALNRKLSSTASLLLSISYSLFYGIQFGVFFDFHPIILGVALLPWLAYFLETNKKKLFVTTLVLVLLTQENMGIAVSCIGLIYVFKKKYRGIAISIIVLGFVYMLVASKVVSFFSPVGYEYIPQIDKNPFHIILNYFNAPEKQQVWFYSLSSFLFLPVLSPGAILAVILDLSQYFVTGQTFARMWSPFMHHRAMLAPLLALGTLDALMLLRKKIKLELLCFVVLFSVLLQQYIFHFPLNKLTKKLYWQDENWMKDDDKLLTIVPKNASVVTQQNLVSHLSHRKEIYLFWPRKNSNQAQKYCTHQNCWWLDFSGTPELLVVDRHPNQWVTQLLESNEHIEQALRNMEEARKITIFTHVNDAYIYNVY